MRAAVNGIRDALGYGHGNNTNATHYTRSREDTAMRGKIKRMKKKVTCVGFPHGATTRGGMGTGPGHGSVGGHGDSIHA